MQKFFSKLLVLIITLILPFTVFAATATEQLSKVLNNLHGLQAQFTQTVQDGQGQVMQQSGGKMALQRPGKFRWETLNPAPQLLIADGEKIWLYDKELQQVTVQKQRSANNASSPALLLEGSTVSLTRDYVVSLASAKGNTETFKLLPKRKDSLFQSVLLTFKQDRLQVMRMLDNLGQETVVTFSQVQLNPTLSPNLFRFTPPKGVDVVTQ